MNKVIIMILSLVVMISAQTQMNDGYGYKRSDWGKWKDSDRNCRDTRQEVLIDESLIPVTMDNRGCKVLSGLWFCLFTGKHFTNPRDLDIDHVVPIKEAYMNGGDEFTKEQRVNYYNDLKNENHLMAVYKGANRRKGARSPEQWMPTFEPFQCTYIKYWLSVKLNYKIFMDNDEKYFIINMINTCKTKN